MIDFLDAMEQQDDNKLAVDVFDKFAKQYQDKFMDLSAYHDTFDLFCSHIKKQEAQVLELACGPGNITQYILKKRPDLNVLGTDLAPNMLELARMNNPTAVFELKDCRNIATLQKKFDAIMCGFALPYLTKQEAIQFIHDAGEILNKKGVFYISTMEDDNGKSGLTTSPAGNTMVMNYHEEKYLSQALLANGFDILKIDRKKYDDGVTKAIDLIILAVKK